ncbi:MAG: 16S rRNA (cytosine(1402)-N(4))-methyltransferase RsmH [Anaerolineales bacterium]|nr:MAG: 16S rRNA (cytosine(1402)-N(4))-methyltransferase RsmH [Anaerolineales bacterium]
MHQPVLYHEIIRVLRPQRGGRYIDCTVGAGGHAAGILRASSPDGCLLGLDVDPIAIDLANEYLVEFGHRAILVRDSYLNIQTHLVKLGWNDVSGIVMDLGVSSMQLDTTERGFSFQTEAPLDMRFNPDNPLKASELVNRLPEEELAAIIYRYGDEKRSRQVARAIVSNRPVNTTRDLARIVAGATTSRRPGMHPATKTFQALRIAVNRELETLETALPIMLEALATGGRLAVIAFHSIEDRIIKQYFRRESQDCLCPPRQPVCTCGHRATLKVITRKPVRPQIEEVEQNPRARSARLRVAEKIPNI